MDGQSRGRAQLNTLSARNLDVVYAAETFNQNSIPVWMLNDHFQEISARTVLGEIVDRPEPDFARYMEEQRLGRLLFLTARLKDVPSLEGGDRELIGYMGMSIERHRHYRQVYVAIDDLHYLMPKYRALGIGKKMIMVAERISKTAGCKIFILRCPANSPHGYIYESMGYQLKDLVYVKDIRHVAENVAEQ